MRRVSVGWVICRTWNGARVDGKTWCAWPHTLFPTRDAAMTALGHAMARKRLDTQYEYDVREVFMILDEEGL